METKLQLVGAPKGLSVFILQSPAVSSTITQIPALVSTPSPGTGSVIIPAFINTGKQQLTLAKPPVNKTCENLKTSESKSSAKSTPPLKPAKKHREEDTEILRCKRKLDFVRRLGIQRPCPVAVAKRNERERKRVKQINRTFLHLRDHLPNTYWVSKKAEKVSKVDTLRAAIDYISGLQSLIDEYDASSAVTEYSNTLLQQQQQQQQSNEPSSKSMPNTLFDSLSVTTDVTSVSLQEQVTSSSPGSVTSSSDSLVLSPPVTPSVTTPEQSEILDIASWLLR